MNSPLLSRREVVRRLLLGTAASWLGGLWQPHSVLGAVTPVAATGTLKLRVSQFPTLGAYGGSVRLNVGLDAPILVNRGLGNTFYALTTRCQHQGCIVNPFNTALNLIECDCHGSTYQIDGTLAGGPAKRSLPTFPITFDGVQDLRVSLPGVTFGAQQIAIESVQPPSRRIRLEFNPVIFTTYEVEYRAVLTDSPQLVPFSLTPTGPAAQMRYTNTDINNLAPTVLLYVDSPGPSGFFDLVQVVTEYQN